MVLCFAKLKTQPINLYANSKRSSVVSVLQALICNSGSEQIGKYDAMLTLVDKGFIYIEFIGLFLKKILIF